LNIKSLFLKQKMICEVELAIFSWKIMQNADLVGAGSFKYRILKVSLYQLKNKCLHLMYDCVRKKNATTVGDQRDK
jgi:hypothetical protein